MLASDSEREAMVRRLRAALLAGRIDEREFEARVERAHGARTRDELDAVAADIPAASPELTATRGRPRLPGRRHFEIRKLVEGTPTEVRADLLARLVPSLERHGFYLHRETDDGLQLANRREMASKITLRLTEAPGGTLLHAHGFAGLAVRRLLA